MMKPLKIIFAGTPEFGIPCLKALHESEHQLISVYTQPDRPAGRGRKIQQSAVKQWAHTQDLPVYQPANFKNEQDIAKLQAQQADVMIVIAYGLLLPAKILAIPRLGCINVHGSLLPRWRGASPIQQAILQGDTQSGITIMQMDVGMDTGPIFTAMSCQLSAQETAASLHDKLAELAIAPLLTTLTQLAKDKRKTVMQDNNQATYARKINKEDALINWQQSAILINRQIRAFNPWPIAHTRFNDEIIRIHEAELIAENAQAKPGTMLNIDKRGILVATSKGMILIKILQFSGGKAMTVADWLNAGRAQSLLNQVLT